MTIFREYGPFKGIHNSTSNLAQKQGYVLKAENMIANQDNGDIQKRPGAILKESLTECIGISRHIVTRSNGDDNLFIAGTECRIKDTIAAASTACLDYISTNFPAKASGDTFSSFLYNGNLYYNYGGKVYKWDNKYAQVVSKKDFIGTSGHASQDMKILARVWGCDINQDVAFFLEKEFNTHLGAAPNPFVFGFDLDIDSGNVSLTGLNNHFAIIDNTTGPIDAFATTSEFTFTVPAVGGYNNLVVGDPVFLCVDSASEIGILYPYQKRAEYRKFFVTASSATQVKVGNPNGFKASAIAGPEGKIILSPFIVQFFRWDTSLGIFMEAQSEIIVPFSFMEFIYPMAPSSAYNFRLLNVLVSNSSNLPYESPVFPRKNLPQCKHISQINALMFMSCPKVNEGIASDDLDFDYQTLAWSSENPEDPIETWGGMSQIIGTEEEGRLYACVPNNGNLVMFKERAIYFSDVPLNGIIQPTKVTGSSVGCKDPQSIQECNGLLLFYVSGKGIYAYRAGMAQAQELSMGFRGDFKTLTGAINSTHDVKGSKYILSIGTTTYVYDYLLDSWWKWTGFNADCGLEYFQEKVVGVSSTFKFYDFEDGVLKDNFGADVAISAFIIPNWFTGFDAEMDKKLKKLLMWSLNGSGALAVDVYKNFRETKVYDFTISDSTDTIDVSDFARAESGHRKFKAITFKIANAEVNKDLKITGWAIDYEPTGVESKNFEGAR